MTPELTKASFPPTGKCARNSAQPGKRACAPLLLGRAGRAPCKDRYAGLDIAVIFGKLKLQPFGWAVYRVR